MIFYKKGRKRWIKQKKKKIEQAKQSVKNNFRGAIKKG
jgi:ribosome recycling factor